MSELIHVRDLVRDYRVARRRGGLRGAFVDLVRPRYRTVRAVDRVSFSVAEGEMVGYIGANGAGKSTTIKMLTGILTPTAGVVTVGGLVPWRDRRHYVRHIGAVFGQRTQLWWDLAVKESFRLLRRVYNVPPGDFKHQLSMLVELLEIEDVLGQPVRKLSLGQRMRCDLAAALLHRPRLLLLDEPTIGLDVVAKETVRRFLRRVQREQGTTILLTTHDLGDIQRLCERILIIDHGRLVFDGRQEELRRRAGERTVLTVELAAPASHCVLAAATDPLPVAWEAADGRRHRAEFSRAAVTVAEVVRRVMTVEGVADLRLQEPDIEQVVAAIYRGGGAALDAGGTA